MSFLIRRLLGGALTLFGVSVLSFIFAEIAPGDFASEMGIDPGIPAQTVKALRERYGLDQSLPVRYLRWAGSVLQGEFGISFTYNLPVSHVLWRPLFNTLKLTVLGLVVAWLAGLALGVYCAARSRSWLARLAGLVTAAIVSMPDILVGLICLLLALQAGLLTTENLFTAVIAMGLVSFPAIFRHTRESLRHVLASGFIENARAHGLPESSILLRYALPAAANPLISLLGLSLASLLSSSLVIEVVLGWPGLGPLLLHAIFARDIHVVVASVLASSALLVGSNVACDLLLYVLDPRIRAVKA